MAIIANGKICYVEIPAQDIERSAGFYTKVFGWKTRKRGDGTTAFDDGVEVSGTWVTGRAAAKDPGLTIYIMVDDIAATSKAIVANGGMIEKKLDVSAREKAATFRDPAGNLLGLYQQR